jgi:hypothetical protein
MYDRFVGEWVRALKAASDLPASCSRREAAHVSQTLMYGLFANTYIGTGDKPDVQALARQARTALYAHFWQRSIALM